MAGLVTVASAAAVSLTSGVAAADTPSYTVTCTGVPVIGTAAFTTVTGTISPNPVNSGSGFSLSGYSLVFTIAPGLVQTQQRTVMQLGWARCSSTWTPPGRLQP